MTEVTKAYKEAQKMIEERAKKGGVTQEQLQTIYMSIIAGALCTIADILEGKNDGSN